ncbi:MAG: protein kinase [Brasilonema octagenarum HA4186-MV1]|jgi:serine/threonine-protein kinase|nr:protein kinase [Brasilonema octagenarum HA4186-MV1]
MTTKLLNNRYQVLQVLGAGGFGETFLAEDTHMPSRRRCVIKQLKPVINNPQTYQVIQNRFEREAATLEFLGKGSDQIPELFGYFPETGQFYLVQEWIQGETLAHIVKSQGALGETTVRQILLSLLSVLDYVHSKGIIHRDIKPDNIIIRSSDGKPVLIDFGAVKETIRSVVSPGGYPVQSLIIGTPGYMPNEQAVGRPVYASDIYSLGMTAIYLLTGKYPSELQTDPQTSQVTWHHLAPQVSQNLVMILNQAIKPLAGDRYTTASKMLYALRSATSVPTVEPTAASQPTVPLVTTSSGGSYSSQYTQPALPSTRKPAVIPTSSTPANWQKPAWIVGSMLVGSLIGAVAIANINRQSSEVPVATSPTSTEVPTANETNPTPATPSPTPTSQARIRRYSRVTTPEPVVIAPTRAQQQPEAYISASPSVVPDSKSQLSTIEPVPEQQVPEQLQTPITSIPQQSIPQESIPQQQFTPQKTEQPVTQQKPQQQSTPQKAEQPATQQKPQQQSTPQKTEQPATSPNVISTPEASTPPPQPEKQSLAIPKTSSSDVPAFPVGSSEDAVTAALGKPTKVSRGAFGRTRAYLYQRDPNRFDLGYLFDRQTKMLRQTEVSFAQSVGSEVMQNTLQGMLGGSASSNIKQGLQQVYERKTNQYSFNVGGLKGSIERNSEDQIYIAIWDASLH